MAVVVKMWHYIWHDLLNALLRFQRVSRSRPLREGKHALGVLNGRSSLVAQRLPIPRLPAWSRCFFSELLVESWSLDRLSREGVKATLDHLEELTSYGVAWRSHTEEYLDSCGIFKTRCWRSSL